MLTQEKILKPKKFSNILILGFIVLVLGITVNFCNNQTQKYSEELNLLERKERGEILTYPEQTKLCQWLSLQPERREQYLKYCQNSEEALRIKESYIKLLSEKSKKVKSDSIAYMLDVAETTKELVKKSKAPEGSPFFSYMYISSLELAKRIWNHPTYNKYVHFKSSLENIKLILSPGKLYHIYFGHVVIKQLEVSDQIIKTQFDENFEYDIRHILLDIGMIADKLTYPIISTIPKNPGTKEGVYTLIFSVTDRHGKTRYYKIYLMKTKDIDVYNITSYYEDKSEDFLNKILTYKKIPFHKYREDIFIYESK